MEIGNNQQPLLLPQDIIEEILPRLPVKSLLRFRCVSKSWRSIIDSEGFIKTHYQNSMQNPSFPQQRVILHNMRHRPMQCSPQSLLNGPYIDPSPLDDPTNIPMNPFQVVGCYNGLVCILEHPRKFFMWNPSTRIAKKLPEITKRSYVVNSGFGWDESSGEYKVFGFVWDMVSQYKYVGKLYSSKTKSWKTIGHLKLPLCWQVGVFVGEKFYWSRDDIVFLDLKSEVFGRFELPFDRPDLYKSLGVLGGFLCMIYHNRDYHHLRGTTFQVWVMKEYGVKESWERVVSLHHVLDLLERPFSTPMMVGPDGEIMVFYGSSFLVYHPQHNVFRHPKIFNKYDSYHLYVESLVSP